MDNFDLSFSESFLNSITFSKIKSFFENGLQFHCFLLYYAK